MANMFIFIESFFQQKKNKTEFKRTTFTLFERTNEQKINKAE